MNGTFNANCELAPIGRETSKKSMKYVHMNNIYKDR